MPPRLTLYTKDACCLCDQALERIERVAKDVPLEIEVVDIARDPDLVERYGQTIPVVALDGKIVMRGKVTEFWLRRLLSGETPDRLRIL